IYWYGVVIAAGLFLGLFIATREADRLGLDKELFIDLIVWAAPISIVFARIYYVIFEWEAYKGGPWWNIFAVWEGGIAIHGDLIVWAAPISIVFARIYYVIFEWEAYKGGPWWNIFAVWEGGIAIHGALIGAVLTAIVYARIKKVSFWLLAEIAAPSLILGQAIGRWGNFMNQEAHGGAISQATYDSFHQYLPDFIMNQM